MTPVEFKKFIDTLKALLPNHAPDFDAHQLSAWYIPFQEYPAQRLFALFPQLSATCDRFPSIKQILDLLEPKADKEAEARVIADSIWSAIERFGSLQSKTHLVRESIGELGWRVVEQMGGWRVVCQIADYDNVGQLKAQWRESIKAHMELDEVKSRREQLGLPASEPKAALPQAEPRPAIEAPRREARKVDLRSVLSDIKTRSVT